MNYQFDELTKGLAQSVTRRGALKKFGLGLAGVALASLGLANTARADRSGHKKCGGCAVPYFGCDPSDAACQAYCVKWCKIRGPY